MDLAESCIGEFFDGVAGRGSLDQFRPEELAQIPALLNRWKIQPGAWVFEPGCGTGRLTEIIAPLVAPTGQVVACDLSSAMLEKCRHRTIGMPVMALQAGVRDLTNFEDRFDMAILLCVLPHFQDLASDLAHIGRMVKKNGRLFVHHFGSRDEVNTFHRNAHPLLSNHLLPPMSELRALLAGLGFEVEFQIDEPGRYALGALRRM